MALVSLKMSKKDMAEEASPEYQQSPYPPGAVLRLDTDELAKMGITSKNLPAVGDEFHVRAVGCVTSVSEDDTAGGGYRCGVTIQIEMMELRHEDEAEGEGEDYASEDAEDAESYAVGGKASTVLSSAYRGKS